MLVIEKSHNGKSIVVFKRDWTPARIGLGYWFAQYFKPRHLDADAMRMRDVVRSMRSFRRI